MPAISKATRDEFIAELAEVIRRLHLATDGDASTTVVEAMQIFGHAISAALGESANTDDVVAAVAGELNEINPTTMAVLGIQKRKRDFT